MNFFKLPPLPRRPGGPWGPPEWYRPDDSVGQPLGMQFALARSPYVVLTIRHLLAYRHGIEFQLECTTIREPDDPEDLGGFKGLPYYSKKSPDPSKLPDGLFRFGLQFSDGSKVTTVRYYDVMHVDRPRGPLLQGVGSGTSGGGSMSAGFWLWPLPPPGPLTFVCEWPALGIELTRHDVDTSVIRESSAKAVQIWPDR